LGALAAEAHLGVVALPAWSRRWWLFPIVCALGAWLGGRFESLFVTVSFFFLIRAATEAERIGATWMNGRLGPLVRLGEVSYGVYLVHYLAFVVAKRLLLVLPAPNAVVLLLRPAAGLAAGYVLYRLVEVPFLNISKRIRVSLVRAPLG
jgi:peptidoglycan/LPS O-acetylase OafA/YrhL